jgi:hypothetical protein
MKLRIYAGLVAVTLSANAWCNPEGMVEKPYIYASQSAQITAVVEAINHETREVTLRGPQGNMVTLIASEEARNLGQVAVGDLVNAEYMRSLSIEVVAGDGSAPGAGAMTAAGRTEEGEMPGAAVMDTQVITASVEEIDIEANTFKLKFPDGVIQQFTARDPENLKRAEVGDMVIITATEALALAVEKAPAE